MTTLAQSARQKKAFLEDFATHGTVTAGAKAAGCGRRTVYDWLARDEEFRKAFAESEQQAIDGLEREAVKRAFAGSDTLLIFLLKGNRPTKYRERVDVTVDARKAAERLAAEAGVTTDELMAEAERIVGKA